MEYWCLEYKFRLSLDMTLIFLKKKLCLDLVMRHKIITDMARVVGLAYPGCVSVPFQTVMTHSSPTLSYLLLSSRCSFCSKVVSLRAS